jgi:hypothetical protein
MRMLPLVALGSLTVALAIPARAQEEEQSVKQSDLPAAVARAVASVSKGATIRGFSRERENGQTYYEVEMRVNGRDKDVLMDTTGAVVEIEEEVALASLPAAVQAGLKAFAGAGTIRTVESLTKHGQLVAYEAHVVTAGKRSEIQVGPDGKPLAVEQ